MSNRIVVTGGAGFIGSHVVEELYRLGHEVFVIDNLSAGSSRNLNLVHLGDGHIKISVADLTSTMSITLVKELILDYDPNVIIDMAASPYIPDSYASFDWSLATVRANIDIVMNMAKIVQDCSLDLYLYVSTSEVYGTAQEKPMSEEHPLNPQSTYASTKLASERLLTNWFYEHNLPTVILRQFNTYGPRATHPYVIPEIISQLTQHPGELELGEIEAKRDFMYVVDAAKIIAKAVEPGILELGGVYNSCVGNSFSVREIAHIVADQMGQEEPDIRIDESRLRPDDVMDLQGRNWNLLSALGYPIEFTPFDMGLRQMIEYYNERGWLWESRFQNQM